ncbi:MAG: ribosome small subunit-dependent GTPase A, partial [Promicromonosporaceae bacterium]|nr:ribosome small subunit-dependent GTPase A [Promicromonosporaceae bacterium]
ADLNLPRLERYLAAAWESGAKPVILLTKADLTEDYSEQRAAVEAIAFGVDVIAISAQAQTGLDKLEQYLAPGETVVFLGSSGVGKSTLVNALIGEQAMAVKEIREHDSRGRHTTTHRQMLLLPGGALVIDTPGMRALTLWDVEAGLNATFGDVTEILERGCRFSNCGHSSEPGCAVLEAIDDGEITRRRWDSYLKLDRENTYYTDREAYSAILREQTKGWREYHRNKGKTIY